MEKGKIQLIESRVKASLVPLQSTVDKLLKKANLSLVVGTSSWREQFVEAITVSAGEYLLRPDPQRIVKSKSSTVSTLLLLLGCKRSRFYPSLAASPCVYASSQDGVQ